MLFTTEDLMKRMNIEIGDVFRFKGYRKETNAILLRYNNEKVFLMDETGYDYGRYDINQLINHNYKIIKGNGLKSYSASQFAKDLGVKPGDVIKMKRKQQIFVVDNRFVLKDKDNFGPFYLSKLLDEEFEIVEIKQKGDIICKTTDCSKCPLYGVCNAFYADELCLREKTLFEMLEHEKEKMNDNLYCFLKEELEKEVVND